MNVSEEPLYKIGEEVLVKEIFGTFDPATSIFTYAVTPGSYILPGDRLVLATAAFDKKRRVLQVWRKFFPASQREVKI